MLLVGVGSYIKECLEKDGYSFSVIVCIVGVSFLIIIWLFFGVELSV